MENASKALIMAGGILISLLVISLLVFFFNNIRDIQDIENKGEKTEQATEFNKQYNVYERDVYGSELLSIANKIADYNKREADNKGYQKIELYVEITKDIDEEFFKKGSYNSLKLKTTIESVEKKIKEYGDKKITSRVTSTTSRKISQLATMRTKDIEVLGIESADYQEDLSKYNTYKTLLTEIKAKEFRYVEFEYDKNTGRIIKMQYKL